MRIALAFLFVPVIDAVARAVVRLSEKYGLLPSGGSASFADDCDKGIGKKRIDEWHLGEAELPFALQFG